MYLSYYGLYKEPFHITPDPEFLFESPSHREAYATIVYGVARRKGFIAVTGEVGTGKTTILRSYLNSLDTKEMQTVYVYSPDLVFDDLLRTLLREIGEDPADETTESILRKLQLKLISLYEENRGMLLVIDEAQNMPVETLEKLRTLSNLETTKDKLLQIVLVGQPELDDKLNLHQLRQLKQRIAVRATLRALSASESMDYIQHRFERAGGHFQGILDKAAMRALVRHAKGSPRALNILCDNVLLAGFGIEQRPIRAALVNEVARDLAGVKPFKVGRLSWVASAAAIAIAVLGVGWAYWPSSTREYAAANGGQNVVYAEASAPTAIPAPVAIVPVLAAQPPVAPVAVVPAPVAPAPIAVAPAPAAPAPVVAEAKPVVAAPAPVVAPVPAAPTAPAPVVAAAKAVPAKKEPAVVLAKSEPALTPQPPTKVAAPSPTVDGAVTATMPAPAVATPPTMALAATTPAVSTPTVAVAPAPRPVAKALPAGEGELARVVLPGENLTRLLTEIYGRSNETFVRAMQERNPVIVDVNMILTGQKLTFPTIDGVAPRGLAVVATGS